MLSAFYMTKNIQIIIYYLIYMVKIQNGRQWTKMATKKMPTTFFLNNMTYFIKKITLAKIDQNFLHIDTTFLPNTTYKDNQQDFAANMCSMVNNCVVHVFTPM